MITVKQSNMMSKSIIFTLAAICMAVFSIAEPRLAAAASQIKIIVNKQAITNTDLSRRVALLRLQRRGGKLSSVAREELIEQALKTQELQRLRASPSQREVDAAFSRFASGNNLSAKRMSSILGQAGVTAKHFKQFIATQIGWGRVVSARYGGGQAGRMSTQDLVSKMLERGDNKPTTNEYILQQVIFVVPQSKRSKSNLGRRNSEAKKLRARIQSCDTTKSLTKGLKDVTVKNLGRFLQPELPPEWSPLITKTNPNKPTRTRVTEKGVEFLIVCSSRSVSDDVAAEMVFRAEEQSNPQDDANSKRYLAELRKRAVIIKK
ncbi:peptidylprolyl isomerase [Lentilitoribacter sp. EG35]|uniref:peptidylprolyl isomerase n=1 Tax=Lentilitoribacter sp. EG35 TaxID=3234192 RepID=UPI0034608F3F